MPILEVVLVSAQRQDKELPHTDSTKQKASTKNSAFTKFKYVAEWRYICEENSPSFVSRTRVQQYARSEVRVPRRAAAPLWRVGYAECCGQEQLLCDGVSVASTVEAPDWCNASSVCKSSMLCCCSTAVDSSPCMRVVPILLSSGPTRGVGTEKKVSVIP